MGKFGETDDGKWKNLAFRLKFLSYWFVSSYWLLCCHTERSEVSTNSKCDFSALRHILNFFGFFAFYRKLKMTKFAVLCKWIFCRGSCALQPAWLLCANALCSKWQNKAKSKVCCHTEPLAKYPKFKFNSQFSVNF